ncbi:MAG: RES family NAD+ phosphorylase [Candidatus Baltobacteraceae bacterium]
MISLWHLVRRAVCPAVEDAWSGLGPYRYGGRWNRAGTYMGYAGGTRSLCALELLVHIAKQRAPSDYAFSYAEISEGDVAYLTRLPADWNAPIRSVGAIDVGENFTREKKTLALAVPSVIIPQEWDFLINPQHPRIGRLFVDPHFEPFSFDGRLFRQKQ